MHDLQPELAALTNPATMNDPVRDLLQPELPELTTTNDPVRDRLQPELPAHTTPTTTTYSRILLQ